MKLFRMSLVFIFNVSALFSAAYEYNPLKAMYPVEQRVFDDQAVATIEKQIGYTFNKKSRLQRAFTTQQKNPDKNLEIYEYKGDAVLKFVQGELIHKKFPKATPGERTGAKSAIESLAPLCALGVYLGLHHYVQDTTQLIQANVIEDVMEALVWAVYKDGGQDIAERFITRFCYPMIKGCNATPLSPLEVVSKLHPGKGKCFTPIESMPELTCGLTILDTPGILRVGYTAKDKKQNPSSRIAEYNAALRYVREHASEEYQKRLITLPLDNDYAPFNEELKLDLHWVNCSMNARARLHILRTKMGLEKPSLVDEPAATKKEARELAAKKELARLQDQLLLPQLKDVGLDDLTMLYVEQIERGCSAKSKINEICKRFSLQEPSVEVRIRAGAVSEPLQYYAVAQAPWIATTFKSAFCLKRAEAEESVYAEMVSRLYVLKRRMGYANIKPKTVQLIAGLENALADTSTSKKEQMHILAQKLGKQFPSMKMYYEDSSLADYPNPLFKCRLSYEDISVFGDAKQSKQSAEESAAHLFLEKWLREARQNLFAMIAVQKI